MKKFTHLIISALIIALMASLFCFNVSAATTATQNPDDARNLKPGSNNVIYISDDIYAEGYSKPGTGTSPDDPLIPITHPDFDPNHITGGVVAPKYNLNTALYQAIEILDPVGGGTIVFCGTCTFGNNQAYGEGSTTKDVFTPTFGEHTIKFTSVYNGVDYRKTNNAKIVIKEAAELGIQGQSIWENVTIVTDASDRCISFSNYNTLVGEGIECYPADEFDKEMASAYISLSGGYRWNRSDGEGTNLVVQSGTYNKIIGGMWGTAATFAEQNAEVYLTIEGTATVLGEVAGTPRQKSPFSGNVHIFINGGTFIECEINGAEQTAFQNYIDKKTSNADGKVFITVTGGNFNQLMTCADAAVTIANPPIYSLLDCSKFKGDELSLAHLIAVSTGFTDGVKLPSGVTTEHLNDVLAKEPKSTTAASTQAATQAPAKTGEATKAPEKTTAKPADVTKSPETDSKKPQTSENSVPSWIWIIIAVMTVVIIGLAVYIVISKKGKSQPQK